MKTHPVLIAYFAIFFQASAGLRCFTCLGATSNDECNEKGEIVECKSNELSCQNEVRISETKFTITKRCKQSLACKNNQEQNNRPAWDPFQCNPQHQNNSVCRCCCEDDLCNQQALPCDENPRCPPIAQVDNSNALCSNMDFEDSICSFQCKQGYNMIGSAETQCIRSPSGLVWENAFPVCKLSICGEAEPNAPSYGQVSCSDGNQAGSRCAFSCNVGYQLIGSGEITCNLNQRWSGAFPTCEQGSCDFIAVSTLENGKVLCGDKGLIGSVCEYECDQDYRLDGVPDVVCQANGKWSNLKPSCTKVACDVTPSQQLLNGESVCSEENFYASVCTYLCYEGYYLVGSRTSTCQEDGFWSNPPPACEAITCPRNDVVVANGVSSCTNENFYSSSCSFTCDEGYFRVGAQATVCQENFIWSEAAPFCQQESCSLKQANLSLGNVACSDENYSFSECDFTCGDGSNKWELLGSNKTTCSYDPAMDSYQWTHEQPCCAKRCPPYAEVDLFLVLDSSSSVGKENWNKTVFFIKDVIDNFIISTEDMLVAAIRYNKRIDESSEIKIGQFTSQKSTTDAIINLPYDGSGTMTGNALTYVAEKMLTAPGNRQAVPDLVLVVTDGISKDDVVAPAKELQRIGANVLAIGVVNENGSLKEEDIAEIAQNKDNAILVKNGFDGLSDERINDILALICGSPCKTSESV
ncbi:E-selectin-like [Clavelina lepadiformis]|uniref:E-selectin-like n=1 Tax=Clavelina lepadiformis TaxID=159417 RepID=UPI004042FE51